MSVKMLTYNLIQFDVYSLIVLIHKEITNKKGKLIIICYKNGLISLQNTNTYSFLNPKIKDNIDRMIEILRQHLKMLDISYSVKKKYIKLFIICEK